MGAPSTTSTVQNEASFRAEPGSAPFVERACTFTSDGLRLVGVLAEPASGAPASQAAILVHGWGSYRAGPHAMLVKLARALAGAGVPALRFDLRGRGDSEGRYDQSDLDGMIADTFAAADYLRQQTRSSRLAAVGLCSGGNVAIGAASLAGSGAGAIAFDKLVPISTLPFQTHVSKAQQRRRIGAALAAYAQKLVRLETYRKLLRGELNFRLIGKVLSGGQSGDAGKKPPGNEGSPGAQPTRNLKDSSRDIVGEFTRYRGELLFIYGGADAEGDEGRRHFEAYCDQHALNARFHVIAGANHNFYSLAWERELIAHTVAFIT